MNTTTPAPVAAVAEDKSFFEQVEEFYEDKNNFAMYLVLPCIVLVYGGCSAIYCCYKCRQQLCSKKKGKGKDEDNDDDKNRAMANQTNDKMSLIGGSPENPGKKAAANQIRPASKASVSDVNVGMGNETPLPWAIPEKEDKQPSPAIVKLPPAYSDFQTNQQANNIQNMQNFNPQLQQAQMQGMQQPMPYNPNAFQMQMMQHPNAMYQPTIIPIPMPMDYQDSKRNNRRDRRLSREDSYDDMDDYHPPPRNQRKQSNNRRNSNSSRSGKQSKHDDFDDSDDDYNPRQGRSGNSRRDSPRNSRTPDRGKHGRERRRSDDRNGHHRDYSPSREDTMSARSDNRRSSPKRRSEDRKSRRPEDRRTKDRGYSPTDPRDRPSREDTMSARSTRRTRSPDERKGRRSDDRDPDEHQYSPTNPRNIPSREDTMSARSDKRRSDGKDDPKPPRKINEVKPTPQKPKIDDKPSDTNPEKRDNNPPKKPPPRPAQPAKKPQNKNQQDDRIMSPPPPYEGHERRNSLDAVFEAAGNPGNTKGPARPSYNPNPTIRVISQTKGGGPVSGMEMAKQAAEMLRVDNPNIGRKKPKRLVFVAE